MLINDQLSAHLTFIASFMIYHTSMFTTLLIRCIYVHPMSYYMLEIKLSYLILKVTYLHIYMMVLFGVMSFYLIYFNYIVL